MYINDFAHKIREYPFEWFALRIIDDHKHYYTEVYTVVHVMLYK